MIAVHPLGLVVKPPLDLPWSSPSLTSPTQSTTPWLVEQNQQLWEICHSFVFCLCCAHFWSLSPSSWCIWVSSIKSNDPHMVQFSGLSLFWDRFSFHFSRNLLSMKVAALKPVRHHSSLSVVAALKPVRHHFSPSVVMKAMMLLRITDAIVGCDCFIFCFVYIILCVCVHGCVCVCACLCQFVSVCVYVSVLCVCVVCMCQSVVSVCCVCSYCGLARVG